MKETIAPTATSTTGADQPTRRESPVTVTVTSTNDTIQTMVATGSMLPMMAATRARRYCFRGIARCFPPRAIRSGGDRMHGAARLSGVRFAHHELFATRQVAAVLHPLRRRAAHDAVAEHGCVVAEIDASRACRRRTASPPTGRRRRTSRRTGRCRRRAGTPRRSRGDLISAGEHLAADAAGAVGDDRLVLEVVVLAAVELGHEVAGRGDVRDHRIPESPDLRLETVAAVEEDDVVAAVDERVDARAAAVSCRRRRHRARRPQFAGSAEADDLVAHLHDQLREVDAPALVVEPGALAPLDVEVLERRVVLRLAQVPLHRAEFAADGAVQSVLRDQDAPAQPERLAEVALPQADGVGVGERREDVEEQDLRNGHRTMVGADG